MTPRLLNLTLYILKDIHCFEIKKNLVYELNNVRYIIQHHSIFSKCNSTRGINPSNCSSVNGNVMINMDDDDTYVRTYARRNKHETLNASC